MKSKSFALLATMISLLVGTAHAATPGPVSGQGTWESSLSARDVNGDGVVDAYYDTVLDITWLADAGAMGGERVVYDDAANWAQSYDLHGITGWRLPTVFDVADGCQWSSTGGTNCGYNVLSSSSEMAHMYSVTLGNYSVANSPNVHEMNNTGPFSNLQAYGYWAEGIVYNGWDPLRPVVEDNAWRYSFAAGRQDDLTKNNLLYAWAVHDGDITAPVPEPETYAMMLAGLGVVGWVGRRRKKQSA